MEIYIDYIFIQNFIFDFILLIQTRLLSRENPKIRKAICASLISSTYVTLIIIFKISFLNYFWCKIALSFVIVYIAFNPENISKGLKLTGIFYLSTILNIGANILVNQLLCENQVQDLAAKIAVYIISLLLTYIYTKQFWKIYKQKIRSDKLNYPVEITLNGKKYNYDGFVDTGNTVYSYELNVPVVFAEYISDEQKKQVKSIPASNIVVSTISNRTNEKVILTEANIKNRKLKLGVVFVEGKLNKSREYNMVLNYKMVEENLGGISI